MSFIVFAMVLSAALLHAIWNTLVKLQGDRLVIMAMITTTGGIISFFALPFVAFPAPPVWPYIWAFLGLHNAYYVFLVIAYKYGDLSHVTRSRAAWHPSLLRRTPIHALRVGQIH